MLLYCNVCYTMREMHLEIKLYLLTCGHVLCTKCLQKKCPICKQAGKPALIDREMSQSIAIFFENPLMLLRRYRKATKFQLQQQNRYFAYVVNELPNQLRQEQKKVNGMIRLETRLDEEIANEKKKIEKLKNYLAYAERKLEYDCAKNVGGQGNKLHNQSVLSFPSTPSISSVHSSGTGKSKSRDSSSISLNNTMEPDRDPSQSSFFQNLRKNRRN